MYKKGLARRNCLNLERFAINKSFPSSQYEAKMYVLLKNEHHKTIQVITWYEGKFNIISTKPSILDINQRQKEGVPV